MTNSDDKFLLSELEVVQDKSANTISFYCLKDIVSVDDKTIEALKEVSRKNNTTARISLHKDRFASMHNMLICTSGSFWQMPIHRHPQKAELYNIISGSMMIKCYNTDGSVSGEYVLGENGVRILRIENNTYHQAVPLSAEVVYLESRIGPFDRETDSEVAPFAVNIRP